MRQNQLTNAEKGVQQHLIHPTGKLFVVFWIWIGQKLVQHSHGPIHIQNTPDSLPIKYGIGIPLNAATV
jgi:hypothetical protein